MKPGKGGKAGEGRVVEEEWRRRARHEDVLGALLGRDICSWGPSA